MRSPAAAFHEGDSPAEDDRALLARLRTGADDDPGTSAAFDAIFRRWYAPLVGVADRMLRDTAAAEELAQDVLLELWRRRATLDTGDEPGPYLIRAVRNRALNRLRHARVATRAAPLLAVDEASPVAGPAAEAVERELAMAIDAAVAALPPGCRQVFLMSRAQGLRYSDIAATLGISPKTVEAQMGRALRLLRARLGPWLPGGDEAG
ncbi:DNA-directed RNA polymerase sigma-70 factor [Gemmatimonadetes bacterium T265]|nr:DNA-directed RNA polymerase sigma-70 factor [Gemmatimonadetes bacterium T265]